MKDSSKDKFKFKSLEKKINNSWQKQENYNFTNNKLKE